MKEVNPERLDCIVEMDETYIGGKKHGRQFQGRRDHKECVIGIRNGMANFAFFMLRMRRMARWRNSSVSQDVQVIMTDAPRAYPKAIALAGHSRAKHQNIKPSIAQTESTSMGTSPRTASNPLSRF
jgi:hypothetical protein